MRPDKFTQKMQEAAQAAQDIASKLSQQEVTNRHFLLALLDQPEGVTRPLLEKMGVSVPKLWQHVHDELDKEPKVHGASGSLHFGSELIKVIENGEREMEKMKDEYLSAEHYLLALADSKVVRSAILARRRRHAPEVHAGARSRCAARSA